MNTKNLSSDSGDLNGIPNLGPSRRAALNAAGIKTRAQLARTSVEKLISLTGIQRGYAVKVLELVQTTKASLPPALPPTVERDEDMPDAHGDLPPVQTSEPTAPEPEPPFALERAVFATRTALSDASRRLAEAEALVQPYGRLALLLDTLPYRADALSAKRQGRIAQCLETLTKQLEKQSVRKGKLTSKQVSKLRDAIKSERDAIRDLLPRKK